MLEFRLGTPWDNPFPETVPSYLDSGSLLFFSPDPTPIMLLPRSPVPPISVSVLAPTGLPPNPVPPYQGLVKPGERGVVRLIYNPKGRVGTNLQRVFVYTDDNLQPTAILRLEVTTSY